MTLTPLLWVNPIKKHDQFVFRHGVPVRADSKFGWMYFITLDLSIEPLHSDIDTPPLGQSDQTCPVHVSLQYMAYRREQTRVYSKLGWMYFVTLDFSIASDSIGEDSNIPCRH